jgi:hypothetical protein
MAVAAFEAGTDAKSLRRRHVPLMTEKLGIRSCLGEGIAEGRGKLYNFLFRRRVASREMEHDKLETVNHCIREAAKQAAASGGLQTSLIERFLRTGEETWDGAGSGRFTIAQLNEDEVYTQATKTALRTLFRLLADLLPAEARVAPQVGPETIGRSIGPMVKGLVEGDWQEVALRELTARTFVLNFQGAKAGMEAELSTCFMGTAWQILWALFGDYGLKPEEIRAECDGVSGGDFAHVRLSAYESQDPYSDVIVHETAHLLHYLKPAHYGLQVRRGQERFVDVEFCHRELFAFACEAYSRVVLLNKRKSRISFAEEMKERAFSFPRGQIEEVAAVVLSASRARNGWRVIREATVIRRVRGRVREFPTCP